jgi:hypothetical protein
MQSSIANSRNRPRSQMLLILNRLPEFHGLVAVIIDHQDTTQEGIVDKKAILAEPSSGAKLAELLGVTSFSFAPM